MRVTRVPSNHMVNDPQLWGKGESTSRPSTYDTRHTVHPVRRSELDANCRRFRGSIRRRVRMRQ